MSTNEVIVECEALLCKPDVKAAILICFNKQGENASVAVGTLTEAEFVEMFMTFHETAAKILTQFPQCARIRVLKALNCLDKIL